MVLVCAACSEPAIVIGEVPLLRVMPTAPRKPTQPPKVRLDLADAQKSRRDRNREAGRCTNHPLTSKGKPHDPPVPGKTKCAACIEVHRRAR